MLFIWFNWMLLQLFITATQILTQWKHEKSWMLWVSLLLNKIKAVTRREKLCIRLDAGLSGSRKGAMCIKEIAEGIKSVAEGKARAHSLSRRVRRACIIFCNPLFAGKVKLWKTSKKSSDVGICKGRGQGRDETKKERGYRERCSSNGQHKPGNCNGRFN